MQDLSDRLGTFFFVTAGNALVVVIVVVVAWLAYRVLARVVRTFVARAASAPSPGEGELGAEQQAIRRAERSRRLETVAAFGLRLVRWFTVAVIASVVVAVFLPSAWNAIGGLGVGFGIAIGGAIGFGTQQLVRDYLNGMLILGENPYSVGDIVAIAGVRGTVEEVGLRRTVIRDMDGTVHSVPNGEILVASNFTRRFARVNERFMVAYSTDIARVTAVINAVGEAFAADPAWAPRLIDTPAVLRVDPVVDPGIPVLVSFAVRPGDQWAVGGEFRRRVLDAFVREGIRLATSQRLQVDGPLPIPVADTDGAESGAEYT
jgi:moderate conductance mechanosensitive channel